MLGSVGLPTARTSGISAIWRHGTGRKGPAGVRLGCAVFAAAVSLMVTALASSAGAVQIVFTPNPADGFNFVASNDQTVGYLYKLGLDQGTGSAVSLTPDLTLTEPLSTTKTPVVAVLSQVTWAGATSSPLKFTGYVSAANRNTIFALLHTTIASSSVSFGFGTFSWDPAVAQYFESFDNLNSTTGSTLSGLIQSVTGNLQLSVSSTPASYGGLTVYQFSININPPATAEQLFYATGPATKVVEAFGMNLGGVLSCVEPKLVGLTEGQARHGLAKADCAVAVRKVHSTKKHRGRVVRASGTAGKTYAAGHKVTVYIGQ